MGGKPGGKGGKGGGGKGGGGKGGGGKGGKYGGGKKGGGKKGKKGGNGPTPEYVWVYMDRGTALNLYTYLAAALQTGAPKPKGKKGGK